MQTEEKIRTFIAINISSELREAFKAFIDLLIETGGDVKWVKAESIHLTLKFLGNLTTSKIEMAHKAMRKICEESPPFSLKSWGKGVFPNLKRPRVFWVGLTESDKESLAGLQSNVESALTQIGSAREVHKFHPHLTVGRVRSSKKINEVMREFMDYHFPEIEFVVNEVLIMKSELTPRGATYSIQKAIPLKN